MSVTVDFTAMSRAQASTALLQARDDPSITAITVMHQPHHRLPDMTPFIQVTEADGAAGTVIKKFKRS